MPKGTDIRHQISDIRFRISELRRNISDFRLLTSDIRPAFTLIELLIIITVLGILATIISTTMNQQQQKARDTQRKSDLTQVKKALEQAKNDCLAGSYYPSVSGPSGFTLLVNILANTNFKYIESVVSDPINTTPYDYGYNYGKITNSVCPNPTDFTRTRSGTSNYLLRAKFEITNDPDLNRSYTKCTPTFDLIDDLSWIPSNPAPFLGDGYYYECND